MNNSDNGTTPSPFHSKKCENFQFISFWSKKATKFVDDLETYDTNDRVSHHDLFVQFMNKECFKMEGKLDSKKRVKGSKHDDLTLPSGVIEFKIRSRGLESLPGVLRDAAEIFKRNDYIYFGYLRKRQKRDESKDIKLRGCIYYLHVVIFSKEIQTLNLRDLVKEVNKEEMAFTKEVAEKSGLDMDDEELYAVGNIIKEIKLERRLEENDEIHKKELEEKDTIIKEKDEALREKDEALREKDEALREKDEALREKDELIKQLNEKLDKK